MAVVPGVSSVAIWMSGVFAALSQLYTVPWTFWDQIQQAAG